MILEKIARHTQKRIDALKEKTPLETVKKRAERMGTKNPFAFEKALKCEDIAFICEIKRASPSAGVISEDFPYIKIAKEYMAAGASAISVLTEPEFFKGDDRYLEEVKEAVEIPVLRKDFIIDPYQIYEAKLIGADAVLLICALLDTDDIKEYMAISDSLGLSCLVEVHTPQEVGSAVSAGARVIGVNNRNLHTFDVNIENTLNLRPLIPEDVILVSESGIKTPSDIEILRQNKVDAVLIGEALMRSEDRMRALYNLRGRQDGN